MCRVAAVDAEVGGTTIPQGNQVVLMYSSANRDEAHFDDPERFDVTRHPNNHIAFGFGTHFCLGASLARLEIKVFFEELLRRTDGLAARARAPTRSRCPTPSSTAWSPPRSSSTSSPDLGLRSAPVRGEGRFQSLDRPFEERGVSPRARW